jgi:hypothetical protein
MVGDRGAERDVGESERGGWLPPYTFGPKVLSGIPFTPDLWKSAFPSFHF